MIKKYKSILVLSAICIITALLMAVTNTFTAPVIEKNSAAAANESLLIVMPNGEGFEKIDISSYTLPSTIKDVYTEKNGGYVVQLVTSGYGEGMTIMCGIDASGLVTGAVCLSSNETLGYEKEYGKNTVGKNIDTISSVDTIAGATLTTKAYRDAIEDALKSVVVFGGGWVDTRTEDEILADNLSTALPAGNKDFEELFITEKVEGVDAVYSAKNNAGLVYVVGESFVGVDANGNIVGEIDATIKEKIESANQVISNSKLTEIDISKLDLPSNILKVSKTATGNFVFELRAAGFGINGDEWYGPSGEYIYISLCATEDKEIISIKTTSQKESKGYGAACENRDFYEQFIGKNNTNYKEIDAISGATITTNGYTTAVGRALTSIDILKGVN